MHSVVRDKHDRLYHLLKKGALKIQQMSLMSESRSMHMLRSLNDLSHLSESESVREYVMRMSGQSDDSHLSTFSVCELHTCIISHKLSPVTPKKRKYV